MRHNPPLVEIIAEALRDEWVPSHIVYGTDEPVGFNSVYDWADHTARSIVRRLTT